MAKLTDSEIKFIDETLLVRGVDSIYPSKEALRKFLLEGKKLKIYIGIDPTAPNIHVGNAVGLRKLGQFQKLGHQIILLIGDFTARLGDPSDKQNMRPLMDENQLLANAETYKRQASKIINFGPSKNPAMLLFNSEWLGQLSFGDIIKLASHFTVQQMIERDLFQKRLAEKKPIGLHEFLYPLMQGYDSVAMEVNMEMGGTDQTFNMLAGRTLLKEIKNKEKFVITTPLLLGTDGRKMSKSFNNYIAVEADPSDKFGKVMSITDELIPTYFELATDVPMEEVKRLEAEMKTGKVNPMDVKKRLAFEIVSMFDGKEAAKKAQEEFERVVQRGELPNELKTLTMSMLSAATVAEAIVASGIAPSMSQAKRLIEQGGVEKDGQKVNSSGEPVSENNVIRVGKRKAVKISR